MISISTFFSFLVASILITLAPGPDNVFVVTQGVAQGRKSALFAAWGMVSGVSVHTLAAALGLSAIIYSSDFVFLIFKYAGAVYLFYMAWLTVMHLDKNLIQEGQISRSCVVLYKCGFLMNVLNPKVGLFFLAFLPQFVDARSNTRMSEMLILGGVFMLQAFILFSLIAILSAGLSKYIREGSRIRKMLSLFAALTFSFFGIKLLLL